MGPFLVRAGILQYFMAQHFVLLLRSEKSLRKKRNAPDTKYFNAEVFHTLGAIL